ncbi:MAG: helix-turn-helix transcriptional regulator [Akkermansiaceae bacterium]|nr:helix-turn-helix transcriptional regulator [Akkermansiaceae bacterium]
MMEAGEKSRNMIGSKVRQIRKLQKLRMADLAARCTLMGFCIEWHSISKIERGIRGVSDLEMYLLAKALRVGMDNLVPTKIPAWKKTLVHPA